MAANVLTFDASRRRVARQAIQTGPGDVLMFSGVRYERNEEAAAPTTPADSADPTNGDGNPCRRM
jgi:hypothetical protein